MGAEMGKGQDVRDATPRPGARRATAAGRVTAVVASALCAVLVASISPAASVDNPVAPGSTPPTSPAVAVLSPTPIAGSPAVAPTATGIQKAVTPLLKSSTLGQFSAVVIDPATENVLLDVRAGRPRIPASTAKLLTASAALSVLDPSERIATVVLVKDATLTIVGGGDSTLARKEIPGVDAASLADLADQVEAKVAANAVELWYDDSLFSGPELGPGWPSSFPIDGVVAPVTSLMVDQGRVRPGASSRVEDPARQAAQVLAGLLKKRGLTVTSIFNRKAPEGSTEVARVESPTIRDLVERMLTDSENDLAEALAHLVGGRLTGKASFATGAKAVEQTAEKLGLATDGLSIVDGSGLSGRDKVPPIALAELLVSVARQSDPALWPIGSGLPVAGFTGTLSDRFTGGLSSAAAGYVRAKTGTLSTVVALAGTVKDVDGRVLVFAVLANDVPSLDAARDTLDLFASRLAKCGCS
ncbi:MAG: D-alanyl-D-alanine carboxypeptidase/D-alanyl-D-alanine-endopeptidase [Actinobacteria bacterium]|nr:D-alanyl-D-alanine carboxypeptidase/D-alanyl-D-alanine-endopeptidase [Actinomycetota bacterium]